MNRYIVEYFLKTRVSLSNTKEQQIEPQTQWKFNFPYFKQDKLTIILLDKLVRHDNVNLHCGLSFFVDIETLSGDEARKISKENVDQIINLISFSTLAFCGPATLVSAISIDSNDNQLIFYPQQIQEQEISNTKIKIGESEFKTIFDSYQKSDEKPRIMRALSWLRKGIGEENVVDEFLAYWTGLETIKNVLQKNTTIVIKKNWAISSVYKYITTNIWRLLFKGKLDNKHEWDKVREIFEQLTNRNDFNKIKQNGRNGLLHGFKQLDSKFMDEIKGYLNPIRKALINCLCIMLEMDPNTTSSLCIKSPKTITSTFMIYKAKIENLPNDLNDIIKNPPSFGGGAIERHYMIDENGRIRMTVKTAHEFICGNNIRCSGVQIELWGDKESGITQVKSGEITVSQINKSSE